MKHDNTLPYIQYLTQLIFNFTVCVEKHDPLCTMSASLNSFFIFIMYKNYIFIAPMASKLVISLASLGMTVKNKIIHGYEESLMQH